MLLREEMRRVLLFLEWTAKQWDLRANVRSKVSLELAEGLIAYASQQAALQRTFAAVFKELWSTPLADVAEVLEDLERSEDNGFDNDDDGNDSSDDEGDSSIDEGGSS